MPKVGVVLSGCGVFDGSEIHEAVLTLYALDRRGAQIICMAPNVKQAHVVNHFTGEVEEGKERNVLVESARIARGDIKDIKEITAHDIDALVFPGGYGAAKNLCNFAFKGADCEVNPDVQRLVREMYHASKPIAAVCIAPALLAKVLGSENIPASLTIGTDEATASSINKMGAVHVSCPVKEFVADKKHKIVSTPAYMLGQRISEVAEGIDKAMGALLEMLE